MELLEFVEFERSRADPETEKSEAGDWTQETGNRTIGRREKGIGDGKKRTGMKVNQK